MLPAMPTPTTPEVSAPTAAPTPLPIATLIAYASPMVAVNFSLVLFMSYVNKYAVDVLLIPPLAMGLIFGAGRLWDAVTDPMAGVWSDRTEHAWGRRRPWIAASAIPIALSGWMVWAPPESLSTPELIAWMTVAVFAFNLAITIFYTPHQALGAELSTDSHVVSRIFAWRQAAGYVGMIGCLVFGMPALMTATDRRGLATTFAIVCGVAVVLSIAISVALLREPVGNRRRGGSSNGAIARDVWRNRYSRKLLTLILIEHTGSGASMVVAPFLMQYVIGLPGKIGEIFLFYVGSSLLSLPLWVWLARRIGKKQSWLIGTAAGIAGYACLFFVGEGDLRWMQMVVTLTGACSACGNVMGQSILADVIDADELETGERKEGAYYSAFTFLYKTSSGIMAMVTGFTLSWVDFVPNAPAQTETTLLAIRSLNAIAPLVSMVIGGVILLGFGLDAAKHAEIRRALDARRAARAA
jgi:GPH family glycoside/pentoside/hexuronide:cation symporter